jgi:GH35 family endo-1,4-beta-xylanase
MSGKIKIKQMKVIKATLILSLLFSGSNAFSQTVPTGNRLKDIGNSCKIGTMLNLSYHSSAIANREFNVITATWYPEWGGWTGAGQYNFTKVNDIINWSENNGKTTIFHMFVGQDKYLPTWFKNGTYSNVEMDNMLKDLIYQTLESNNNKTKIDIINVANELFNDNGTYRSMKWNQLGWEADVSGLTGEDKVNTQHPVFIGKAFQYCRDKSTAKLELRDYNITCTDVSWGGVAKHKAFYQLVKHMLAKAYPLNAVSEQTHSNVGCAVNPTFQANLQKFKDTGLEVYLSEVDCGVSGKYCYLTWDATALTKQQADFQKIVTQAISAGVSIINFWGTNDGDPSWRTNEHHLLFDANGDPKPAYYGVQTALRNLTTGSQSLQNSLDEGIRIIPNPVGKENFSILYNSGTNQKSHLSIYDLKGRLIYATEQNFGLVPVQISTGKVLAQSTYLVEIKSNGKVATSKLVMR